MRARRRQLGVVAALVTLALLLVLGAQGHESAAAGKPKKSIAPLAAFDTGIDDSGLADPATAPTALARAAALHVSHIRIVANWSSVAPDGAVKPAGFDARNPGDARYRWKSVDAQVRQAVKAGFTPYLLLLKAPRWAQIGTAPAAAMAGDGAWRPDVEELGNFAHAAAVRYSGSYADAASGGILPRVAIWQAWNEPNLPFFLAPSTPDHYRGLLNEIYGEVKAVQPTATIVTAGLAPVKSSAPAAFPKEFAQRLMCLTPSNGWFDRDPGCATAKFDVLSVHPYSLRARPTQRAGVIGNMFVPDVLDIAQMLRAAQNDKSVSSGAKRLWVTEFAWFTNSPNKSVGDPPSLAATRTATALYLFWRAGVSQLTWYALSDNSESIVKGGGLFDSAGRAKPTYDALRFPFLARLEGRKLMFWGRSPFGGSRPVSVRVLRGGASKPVITVTPAANGVFQDSIALKRKRAGQYFAQQGGERSLTLGSRDFLR